MWNEPSEEQFKNLPELFETKSTPLLDKLMHEHFFLPGFTSTPLNIGKEKRSSLDMLLILIMSSFLVGNISD